MSAVGLTLAIAFPSFVLGLVIANAIYRRDPRAGSAEIPSAPEWTCTWEAMKETDSLGRLIGDAVFYRVAKTTVLINQHGTPHIDAIEVAELCDIVLDHANSVISQWKHNLEAEGGVNE